MARTPSTMLERMASRSFRCRTTVSSLSSRSAAILLSVSARPPISSELAVESRWPKVAAGEPFGVAAEFFQGFDEAAGDDQAGDGQQHGRQQAGHEDVACESPPARRRSPRAKRPPAPRPAFDRGRGPVWPRSAGPVSASGCSEGRRPACPRPGRRRTSAAVGVVVHLLRRFRPSRPRPCRRAG